MRPANIRAAAAIVRADHAFVGATCEMGSRAAWAALRATAALQEMPQYGRVSVTVTRPGAAPEVIECVPG